MKIFKLGLQKLVVKSTTFKSLFDLLKADFDFLNFYESPLSLELAEHLKGNDEISLDRYYFTFNSKKRPDDFYIVYDIHGTIVNLCKVLNLVELKYDFSKNSKYLEFSSEVFSYTLDLKKVSGNWGAEYVGSSYAFVGESTNLKIWDDLRKNRYASKLENLDFWIDGALENVVLPGIKEAQPKKEFSQMLNSKKFIFWREE